MIADPRSSQESNIALKDGATLSMLKNETEHEDTRALVVLDFDPPLKGSQKLKITVKVIPK